MTSIHRIAIFFWALILSVASIAQNVDTVVNMGIYKSYFSNALKQPLYVTYKLYKGESGCDPIDAASTWLHYCT